MTLCGLQFKISQLKYQFSVRVEMGGPHWAVFLWWPLQYVKLYKGPNVNLHENTRSLEEVLICMLNDD